jgi:hypothetical protein
LILDTGLDFIPIKSSTTPVGKPAPMAQRHECTKTRSFLYKSKKLVIEKCCQPFEPIEQIEPFERNLKNLKNVLNLPNLKNVTNLKIQTFPFAFSAIIVNSPYAIFKKK